MRQRIENLADLIFPLLSHSVVFRAALKRKISFIFAMCDTVQTTFIFSDNFT